MLARVRRRVFRGHQDDFVQVPCLDDEEPHIRLDQRAVSDPLPSLGRTVMANRVA